MELRWLPFASEQLRADMQYVVDNFGEITAKKSLRRILDKVNELRKNPDIGIWDKKFSSDGIKVRHLNIGPNMVFYLVDRYEVVVIAVMHCKQSSYVINRAIRYALMKFFES
ncbi:type II toxin-antitoxin system RelE/ParE family toxin [Segatella copri]|jgi:plasmid stabilization system protein ParE|uniref:type II toxin-antitoxin system RelE/ParE family toxin n=1 Tax=Segatella copri TaxID=165179 RepID=UPI0019335FB3|nr:type II toxin-antitoxin system RelE/ParE family toxin [Segatella copri]MBM0130900.1 type II toxin-antitoxin system RelE/ParE family toxin [Segatella copri]